MPRPIGWAASPARCEANKGTGTVCPQRETSLARLAQTTVTREARWANVMWGVLALCGGVTLVASLL